MFRCRCPLLLDRVEDQETHAGKTRPATNRLDYSWMNPPDEPTPEETHEVCQALPHQQKLHGITVHCTGEPNTTRWYTDGSKRLETTYVEKLNFFFFIKKASS